MFMCYIITPLLLSLCLSHGALCCLILRTGTDLWKNRWQSATVEKLEVTECCSGALCLTLTTAHHTLWYCEVCTGFQYSSESVSRLPSLWWIYIHSIACRYWYLQELCVPVENVGGHSGHSLLSASAECIQQLAIQTSSTGQPQTAEFYILWAYSMEWPAISCS